MLFFDPMYLLFALPGLILAGFASFYTKSTFKKYSKIANSKGITGAEAAKRLLLNSGISDVSIEQVGGFLSDHYDPSSKTLRLSPDVYSSNSLSAIGVACHEAGHALQHANGYVWLNARSLLVPAVNVSSNFSYIVIMAGMFMHSQSLVLLGAILFSGAVVFSVVTLPVEWDASARAKELMVDADIVDRNEASSAGTVLNAAFLTYVASAVSSLLTLAYYLMRAGIFGNDD
jgi:Zn-dependent membrane protease YugP